MNKTKTERNSAFEILRIVAIIFIIAHHFVNHGYLNFWEHERTTLLILNENWADFLEQLGKVGVNLFILISSFFLIDNNKFKTKKVIALLIEMFIFSVAIGTTFFFIKKKAFEVPTLKTIIFPFGKDIWWFMTCYLLLYLFSPLLNLGIRAMNKKMHLIMVIVFLTIWSVLPTLLDLDYGFINLGWFVVMYLVGSYIKLHDVNLKLKPIFGILISIAIFLTAFALKRVIYYFVHGDDYFVNRLIDIFGLINMNNLFQVAATLILFLSFKNIKMGSIKFVNIIASTCLASYLLHDHGDMRYFLWWDLFKNRNFVWQPVFIPYSLGVILVVFLMGVVVGLLYNYTIGLGVNKLLDILDKKVLYKIDDVFNKKQVTEE